MEQRAFENLPTSCALPSWLLDLSTASLGSLGRQTHIRGCVSVGTEGGARVKGRGQEPSAAGGGVHETLFLVGLHVTRGCGEPGRAASEGWCSPTVVGSRQSYQGAWRPSVLRLLGRLGHSLEEGAG